jgi:hypothetical protein
MTCHRVGFLYARQLKDVCSAESIENERGDQSPHSRGVDRTIESGDLRVVLLWRGDRFGHRIERVYGGARQVLLESVEGSPADDWPVSPALQSLHVEHRREGPVALLVGKAGASHWSASVEPLEATSGFRFDIACRTGQPPRNLGSTYRCQSSDAARLLVILPEGNASGSWEDWAPAGSAWRIAPIEIPPELPATVRWRYTITVSGGPAV